MTTFKGIQAGDRVTGSFPNGRGRNGIEYKNRVGRAALVFHTHVVLNMGGKHGTPAVVDSNNYVSHSQHRRLT
jgi:hypothetical protein